MSSYKHISYINLGAYITALILSNNDVCHRVPLFSVRHWARSAGVLLSPLEALMSCEPGSLSNGLKFDINDEGEIDTSRGRFGAGYHDYCSLLIVGQITPEILKLEKAIEGYHAALGLHTWLSGISKCGLESESKQKAALEQLVINTNTQQGQIKARFPKVSDMVNEPDRENWTYHEQEVENWKGVIELVANSIYEFTNLALEKTKKLISENYICSFNPLRDEIDTDEEVRHSHKVLDSLSSGQFGLVIGEEGIGKTMLSLDIGLEISNLKEQSNIVSGIFEVNKPGAVIGVFQEDDRKNIKQRCINIGERLGIKSNPYFGALTHEDFDAVQNPSDRKDTILKSLQEALAYKGAPGWRDLSLIIIDPIGLLIEGDESNAEPMKTLCEFLSLIAREYNCAVLGIHHPTKSAKLKPYGQGGTLDLNAAAGHPILTRCARWVLNISRAKKDAIKLKVTKSNNGELTGDIHQLVKVNERGETYKSGDRFAGFAIDKNEGDAKSSIEKIYEVLSCIDLSMHTKTKVIADICGSTGYSRNKVREAIEQLEDTGRIVSNRTVKGIQLALVSSE